MDETATPPLNHKLYLTKLKSRTFKRTMVIVAGVIGLALGVLFLRSATFSRMLSRTAAAAGEVVMTRHSMSYWVDATGTLRASSVRNFSAPPPFGEYWQFQLVSMAPEGNNVKSGDVLISFDAQKVREDLQRYQSELDQANKELEKTRVSIDLERQGLESRLAAAQNKLEKLKLKQGAGSDIEASNVIEKDNLAVEQARREVEAL